jgi:anthranilate synthase
MKFELTPNIDVYSHHHKISLADFSDIYGALRKKEQPSFLFESRSINPIYGRMSLIGVNPTIEIVGKDDTVSFRLLEQRGEPIFSVVTQALVDNGAEVVFQSNSEYRFYIPKDTGFVPEHKRTRKKNITMALRKVLDLLQTSRECSMGLYGAFSYDFARLFEKLPELHENSDTADFHFFVFDTFLRSDEIQEKAEIITYRNSKQAAESAAKSLLPLIEKPVIEQEVFAVEKIDCDTPANEYEENVKHAKELAQQGEIFEVVFSRKFFGDFSGDPYGLYRMYREKNPAPYLFYFDFGSEQLLGASPEMMVRVENGKAHLRPISGTRPRGADPISDHENELDLLKSTKERAELDMLIDLGRNDLKRVCQPGIDIITYRHVEKYSRVMHTIAHLTGKMQPEFSALDALVACQSAGTLTGAPKVQAMIEIEKTEKSRRGYYGGSIGYLTFGGEMDTGIIIRSAHFKNGAFTYRVGATLLFDSNPQEEREETDAKAKALLDLLKEKHVGYSV